MLVTGLNNTDVFQEFFAFLFSYFNITSLYFQHKGRIMCLIGQIPSIGPILDSRKPQLIE